MTAAVGIPQTQRIHYFAVFVEGIPPTIMADVVIKSCALFQIAKGRTFASPFFKNAHCLVEQLPFKEYQKVTWLVTVIVP